MDKISNQDMECDVDHQLKHIQKDLMKIEKDNQDNLSINGPQKKFKPPLSDMDDKDADEKNFETVDDNLDTRRQLLANDIENRNQRPSNAHGLGQQNQTDEEFYKQA